MRELRLGFPLVNELATSGYGDSEALEFYYAQKREKYVHRILQLTPQSVAFHLAWASESEASALENAWGDVMRDNIGESSSATRPV